MNSREVPSVACIEGPERHVEAFGNVSIDAFVGGERFLGRAKCVARPPPFLRPRTIAPRTDVPEIPVVVELVAEGRGGQMEVPAIPPLLRLFRQFLGYRLVLAT